MSPVFVTSPRGAPESIALASRVREIPLDSTALVYCEGNFGRLDGKTANGLVRHSEKYEILGVIDSTEVGRDAGELLDGVANGIPIYRTVGAAIRALGSVPTYFIFGMAPASGVLSADERDVVLDAIATGMSVVNGLHEFLNEDPEFVAAAIAAGVTIHDVRRPPAKADLRLFTGRIAEVDCPRIAVLGTDGAIGKRTTATLVTRALVQRGIRAVMVGTGQTSRIQGAKYGVALDAIAPQYCSGELEAAVIAAYVGEDPDVIIVEGQGALSHPAYLTSAYILRGSQPAGVILQHAPNRKVLGDYPALAMPTVESEIRLIEAFAPTRVIGIGINHEGMSAAEIATTVTSYEATFNVPATDPLTGSPDRLVDMVLDAFPGIGEPRPPR